MLLGRPPTSPHRSRQAAPPATSTKKRPGSPSPCVRGASAGADGRGARRHTAADGNLRQRAQTLQLGLHPDTRNGVLVVHGLYPLLPARSIGGHADLVNAYAATRYETSQRSSRWFVPRPIFYGRPFHGFTMFRQAAALRSTGRARRRSAACRPVRPRHAGDRRSPHAHAGARRTPGGARYRAGAAAC